jgi:hypothetical protein
MLKGLSAVCISLLALFPVAAQDQQDVSNPAEQAYQLSIVLKVLDRDAALTTTRQARMVTLPGKPMGIKLDGRTIQGMVAFTIYAEKDKPTVCLAQAQLLVKEDQGKEGEWVTILKSIPFVLGQKLEFYPLGKDSYSGSNLLFELTIDRYEGQPPSPSPTPRPGFPH